MRGFVTGLFVSAIVVSPALNAQAFFEEELSNDDLQQFFSLIEDGKISADKMRTRCAEQQIAFTFVGRDLVHEGGPQRVFYNVTREDTSADGRTLRAKHFNASFGEWTGAVFKSLCPGIYSISVDFTVAKAGDWKDDVAIEIHLKRAEDERPGPAIVSAIKKGRSPGGGHATLAVPLLTGDEISTWSVGANDGERHIEQVTLTAFKAAHVDAMITEMDMDGWTAELIELKSAQ